MSLVASKEPVLGSVGRGTGGRNLMQQLYCREKILGLRSHCEPEIPDWRFGVGDALEGVEPPARGGDAGEALDGGAARVKPHVVQVLPLVVGLLKEMNICRCRRI